MKFGNWIPMSKGFINQLPKDRPYTKLEEAYSLQIDYDQDERATIRGYASLWQWSAGKVYRFLNDMGVKIFYPESTHKKQNQNGTIMNTITVRSDSEKRTIRLIDNNNLETETERSDSENGTKTVRSRNTTIDPKYKIKNSRQEKAKNPCPHDQIVDFYHDILPELPRVKIWSDRRKSYLEARWKERFESNEGLKSNTLEFWKGLFSYIRESDFLMGRKTGFKANLEWIVTKRNFYKIIEGVYDNNQGR